MSAPSAGCNYRGRFAPSPTGPLHFGSLIAALGSYARARSAGGEWWLRIDDIDPPREAPGAAAGIVQTLRRFGFVWDAQLAQSTRSGHYAAALTRLSDTGLLYGCSCSRRLLRARAARGTHGPVYPGTCRGCPPAPGLALRVLSAGRPVRFDDLVQGVQHVSLARALGDFVVRRRDGLFAYHLACAVDDGDGITEVVRGADLLGATAPQIYLQRLLGLPTPRYAHLPLARDARGHKLSKQTLAAPLDAGDPLPQLHAAWRFLGQVPLRPRPRTVAGFWTQAQAQWALARVPRGNGTVSA